MSYLMLSDDLTTRLMQRPSLDRSTRMLYIELLTYCSRMLTDGVINVSVSLISDHPDIETAIAELIERGLVEDHGDTYYLPEFLDTNYTAERVERFKAAARKRKSDYNERQALHVAGDHSKCTRNCPAKRDQLDNSSGTRSGTRSERTYLLSSPKKRGESADAPQRASGAPAASSQSHTAHLFVAKNQTDHCLACDMPRSNRIHQTDMPDALTQFAAQFAERGLTCRAVALLDQFWCLIVTTEQIIMNTNLLGTLAQPGQVKEVMFDIKSTGINDESDLDQCESWLRTQLKRLDIDAEIRDLDSAEETWMTIEPSTGADLAPVALKLWEIAEALPREWCQG